MYKKGKAQEMGEDVKESRPSLMQKLRPLSTEKGTCSQKKMS